MRAVLFILILSAVSPRPAHAQEDQQCKSKAQEAKAGCDGDVGALNGQDGANAAAGSSQMASNPGMANMGSSNLCPRIAQQKQNIDNATNACQAKTASCRGECEQLASQWDSKPPQQRQGPRPNPGDCDSATAPDLSKLASSGAPLPGQSSQACDSGKQASSMPPMSPPQSGGDKNSQPPTTPDQQKQIGACGQSGTEQYTECNATFTQNCSKDMSGGSCGQFIQRYCNSKPSGGGSSSSSGSSSSMVSNSGPTGTVNLDGQSLTPGRVGEGVGTSFCDLATANNFCNDASTGQAIANRADCNTCRYYRAATSAACQTNPSLCAAQGTQAGSCPVPEPILASQSSGGGGGSTVSTGLSPQSTSSATATLEGNANGKKVGGDSVLSVGVNEGEGGGGGSGSGGGSDRNPSGIAIMSTGAVGHGKGLKAKGAVEVATEAGPNLFNISSQTYQHLCSMGRLHHCGSQE